MTGSPASRPRPNPLHIALWIAILFIMLILWGSKMRAFQAGLWTDDIHYILLSRNILSGTAYRLTYSTTPETTQFPFGFPLLLSPISRVAPQNTVALSVVSLVASLICTTLVFWSWPYLTRRSYNWGITVTGLFAFSPLTTEFTHWVMSEPVFTAFLLGALLVLERLRHGQKGWFWPVAFGILLFGVAFTRTIGWVAVLFAFGYLLFYRRKRAVLPISSSIATMAFCLTLVIMGTSVAFNDLLPASYLKTFHETRVQVAHVPSTSVTRINYRRGEEGLFLRTTFTVLHIPQNNLPVACLVSVEKHAELELPSLISPAFIQLIEFVAVRFRLPFLPILAASGITLIVVLGYRQWLREEGINSFSGFGLLYLFALVFWAWRDERFLYPIHAQLLFAFVLGGRTVLEQIRLRLTSLPRGFWSGSAARYLPWGIVGLFLIGSLLKSVLLKGSRPFYGDLSAPSQRVKELLPTNAVLLTDNPDLHFLYSGRHGVDLPEEELSPEELIALLRRERITHILIAPDTVWSKPYRPQLGRRAKCIHQLIPDLIAAGVVKEVYRKDSDAIAIYAVRSF